MKRCSTIFLLLFLLSSCSKPTPIAIDKNLLSTQIVATITAEALINLPSSTLEPSKTPFIPTNTPAPEPIILSGSGDSVVDFENPFEIALVHIIGNKISRHFAVKNYDDNGNSIDLLVNTTDPYDGIRPLDFRSDEHTTRFEINSSGEWSIEILPITSARVLFVPGVIEGIGDDVIVLDGSKPDLAIIRGNNVSRHFAVIGYGDSTDLLVNTTNPYEGTVMLERSTILLEITSEDKWTIDISGK